MRESAPPPIDLSETVDGAFPAVAPARAASSNMKVRPLPPRAADAA
jgi:hypothetical protein